AFDNETYSGIVEHTILIDALDVGDIGYLTDDDGNGIYDKFHDTNVETSVEQQEDGTYLIDSDGDGNWDYIFDLAAGTTVAFEEETTEGSPWMIIIISIAIVIIAVITFLYKKEYF
ncbi:MAG: hypothetical protein KAS22_14100, partial [Candidatus Heimdallarchaeota archaeon]|nr:hypothetical protein [Candidatus Heimdallarchaeota archaeon]